MFARLSRFHLQQKSLSSVDFSVRILFGRFSRSPGQISIRHSNPRYEYIPLPFRSPNAPLRISRRPSLSFSSLSPLFPSLWWSGFATRNHGKRVRPLGISRVAAATRRQGHYLHCRRQTSTRGLDIRQPTRYTQGFGNPKFVFSILILF